MGRLKAAVLLAAPVLAAGLVVGCAETPRGQRPATVTSGDADIGAGIIRDVGCGSCHRIPGIEGADGLVGPPLDSMARRTFIAGELANNEQNMVRWVMDPQSVEPGTAMPNLGLTEAQARDVAAYLASLD
jgi:cytochrome c1